jgi:hypothetical protein
MPSGPSYVVHKTRAGLAVRAASLRWLRTENRPTRTSGRRGGRCHLRDDNYGIAGLHRRTSLVRDLCSARVTDSDGGRYAQGGAGPRALWRKASGPSSTVRWAGTSYPLLSATACKRSLLARTFTGFRAIVSMRVASVTCRVGLTGLPQSKSPADRCQASSRKSVTLEQSSGEQAFISLLIRVLTSCLR